MRSWIHPQLEGKRKRGRVRAKQREYERRKRKGTRRGRKGMAEREEEEEMRKYRKTFYRISFIAKTPEEFSTFKSPSSRSSMRSI